MCHALKDRSWRPLQELAGRISLRYVMTECQVNQNDWTAEGRCSPKPYDQRTWLLMWVPVWKELNLIECMCYVAQRRILFTEFSWMIQPITSETNLLGIITNSYGKICNLAQNVQMFISDINLFWLGTHAAFLIVNFFHHVPNLCADMLLSLLTPSTSMLDYWQSIILQVHTTEKKSEENPDHITMNYGTTLKLLMATGDSSQTKVHTSTLSLCVYNYIFMAVQNSWPYQLLLLCPVTFSQSQWLGYLYMHQTLAESL